MVCEGQVTRRSAGWGFLLAAGRVRCRGERKLHRKGVWSPTGTRMCVWQDRESWNEQLEADTLNTCASCPAVSSLTRRPAYPARHCDTSRPCPTTTLPTGPRNSAISQRDSWLSTRPFPGPSNCPLVAPIGQCVEIVPRRLLAQTSGLPLPRRVKRGRIEDTPKCTRPHQTPRSLRSEHWMSAAGDPPPQPMNSDPLKCEAGH